MILREFDASGGDAARLTSFACSSGPPFENEVEDWIRTSALAWLNDLPRARFQRRGLGLVEDEGELVAVVAWQDIARIDLEGVWLEVLAVGVAHQHSGRGLRAYAVTIDHLRKVDRDGDHLAGLVHVDNLRSKRLLDSVGWTAAGASGDHEIWVGRL